MTGDSLQHVIERPLPAALDARGSTRAELLTAACGARY